MALSRSLALALLCLVAASTTGCAALAWQRVKGDDRLVSYRRYVNEYPDTKYADLAREHIAYHELRRKLSFKGYMEFRREYPGNRLTDGLREEMEPLAFEHARFAGSVAAYREFLELFPKGELHDRALGNLSYLEAGGFVGRPQDLERFATEHPRSDYAPEARRSVEALGTLGREDFSRVGLVIRLSSKLPQAKSVAEKFRRVANQQYRDAGRTLVSAVELKKRGDSSAIPAARLVIVYHEGATKSEMKNGDFIPGGRTASALVSLYAHPDAKPVWQRRFKMHLDFQQHVLGRSLIFHPEAEHFWRDFFVPVSSGSSQASVRRPTNFEASIVAIDSVGDRSVVLHENGDFVLLELADSEKPLILSRYRHPVDLTRWNGIRMLGDRVILYGEDGLEIVGFGRKGSELVGLQERQTVGSIRAVEVLGEELLLASSRGLLMTRLDGGEPRRYLRHALRGVARVGEYLLLVDDEMVYVSTIPLIGKRQILHKIRLGYEFAPKRLIPYGESVLVVGGGGLVVVDLAGSRPQIRSNLSAKAVGRIDDATVMGGRVFLLGERGLQMLDARAQNVAESVNLEGRRHLSRSGRFLVVAGAQGLQMVDTTALVADRKKLAEATSSAAASQAD